MTTILITGGAGFIGSCLVRQLSEERAHVRIVNLDKLTYAGSLLAIAGIAESPTYRFVLGDVGDATLVSRLLQEHRPEMVVHLAAESHVDRSIDGPGAFVKTNVLGTFTMLESCRRYWSDLSVEDQQLFRFLHVSTDEVYGSLGSAGKFSETTPYAPRSPYAASKAAADHFVSAYHHTYGLPTLVTNCSNNYGPFQFPEKLIPLMVLNAIEGKPLPVYGDGLNIRDWLFVEDHCRALRVVLERGVPGQTYNIGGNCEQTNIELVTKICRLVDQLHEDLEHRPCERLIEYVADRPGHDRRYAIDTTKIEQELGWRPQQTLESGLQATVQWYLRHADWVESVTSGHFRRERLGLG